MNVPPSPSDSASSTSVISSSHDEQTNQANDQQRVQFQQESGKHPEEEVVRWMRSQVAAEVERFKKSGANAIPVPVKNMGILRSGRKTMVNRVECDTAFDFDKVRQIMVSDSVRCPVKENYSYVNVLCFTTQPLPLILPYLYHDAAGTSGPKNSLRDWLFVNNKMIESRHQVKEFKAVTNDG